MARYEDAKSPFGFEDLEVYKAARAFRQRVYKLASLLPPEEKYGLAQQMRRAAVSITSNIAEGYGRHHWQENTQFCRHSRGSLMELIDQINVCLDEEYAEAKHLTQLKTKDVLKVLKLLNGYIAYLQKKKQVEE
ncbi:MAG: four helix bundle protein [Planctomycetaceae bacterium]|nr:four helix bundle protein [Planctomycetaceae bacterium]